MHPNLRALSSREWMAWWIAELQSRRTLLTGSTGQQKPQEFQWTEVQSSAPQAEKHHAWVQSGKGPAEQQPCGKRTGDYGGPKVECKPRVSASVTTQQRVTSTSYIQEGSSWTWGISSSPGEWYGTETGCPEGSWGLHPQGFTRPGWIKLQLTWCIDGDSAALSRRLD